MALLELQHIHETSNDILTYWASNYRHEKITSAIESLHQKIEKGTKFKKSQAAYVRDCLDGAIIPTDAALTNNKNYALKFAKNHH